MSILNNKFERDHVSQPYRFERLDEDCAVLEHRGAALRIPAVWLPAEAQPGRMLLVTLTPEMREATIRIELAEPTEVERILDLEA